MEEGKNTPDRGNFDAILRGLFGEKQSDDREEFIRVYNLELQFRDPLESGPEEFSISAEVVQQVAAAYQFGVKSQRIEPHKPELQPTNQLARDLYDEFCSKVSLITERVQKRLQDNHVITSFVRLNGSLLNGFENIRPGVIQSRLRTIESIRDAYDTDEGRDQTFPDFRAMVDDVWQSGQDLLTQFPEIREIERQRVALEVERSPGSAAQILESIKQIGIAAEASGIATDETVLALTDNVPQMEAATTIDEKVNLVGDSVLTARNFLSAAIRAIATTSQNGAAGLWSVIRQDLGAGTQDAARMLPTLAVIALFTHIAGPVGGIAALLKSDVFRSVSRVVSQVKGRHDTDHKEAVTSKAGPNPKPTIRASGRASTPDDRSAG